MAGSGELRDVMKAFLRKEYKNIKEDDLMLGRVVAVYDEPGDPYYGTVDVEPSDGSPVLYNVRVNAVMENASRGSFTFPKLYSDVVVVKFQKDLDAVVLLYSHIEKVEHILDREHVTRVQRVSTPDPGRFQDVEESEEYTQIRQTDTDIELEGSVVKAGSDMGGEFEPMVLGNALGDLLSELINTVKGAKTVDGKPLDPATIAELEVLSTKVETIKSQVCQVQ